MWLRQTRPRWPRLCPATPAMLAALLASPVKTFAIAAAVFIPFERVAGRHAAQRVLRRGWGMDVLTGAINGLLLYVTLLIALGAIDAGAGLAAPQLRAWIAARPLWAQGLIALLLGDLGVYAIHRLQHTVPWLWRFHAVHHSAEEMDWLVGLRFHPLDIFVVRLASIGPLVALNLGPAAIGAFMAASAWQGWLVHANVRVSY